ncbi:putative NAD(P)H dehydrogenase (quinone) [Vibrio ichthyoenteri ATCC 700023]|uniref:Putative NAD(P)H dehydrogenase (Quinone) n=1 Tax=Vibrio ichthyoenteri ATCC 700023 TaxID=870968 RepID=F9S2E2_9VIBR|nr:NAD(P)H-dependent oxidoreductase [Vibrio ichthyoenteri]EGU39629.1 putative NAD(P)H dehydrogenase (quinone) [Vibrio ichthyoenteri ATCC 700023]
MHVLIVHCHPEPQSFNASMTNLAVEALEQAGHKVVVSDLYAQKFDPVERAEHYKSRIDSNRFDILSEQRNAYKTQTLDVDIKREIERLEQSDLVIFQFPLWWHQQPAMLKGWFDRVFVGGGLYTSTMRYDKGYFRGRRAICSVTSGAPLSTFTENGRGGGEIEILLRSINFSLHYMGFEVLPPYLATEIQNRGFTYKTPQQFELDLEAILQDWRSHVTQLNQLEPMHFYGWKDWDESGAEVGL